MKVPNDIKKKVEIVGKWMIKNKSSFKSRVLTYKDNKNEIIICYVKKLCKRVKA